MSDVKSMPQWMWWTKGECIVEILKTGHFPTTILVRLPNDTVSEVDNCELTVPNRV